MQNLYDIIVVGGGPVGITVASALKSSEKKTLLIEEKSYLGGSTIYQNSENFKINNQISNSWLE